ncbi:hypothetical protein WDU94_002946 [Cyamophila willieti]
MEMFEPIQNKTGAIESIIIPEHIIPVDLSPHTLRTELVILCRRYETPNEQEVSNSVKNKEDLSKREGKKEETRSEKRQEEMTNREEKILNPENYVRKNNEILKRESNNQVCHQETARNKGDKQEISKSRGETTNGKRSDKFQEIEEVEGFAKRNHKPTATDIVKGKSEDIKTGRDEDRILVESAQKIPLHTSTKLLGPKIHKVVENNNDEIKAIGVKDDNIEERTLQSTLEKLNFLGRTEETDKGKFKHLENENIKDHVEMKEEKVQTAKEANRGEHTKTTRNLTENERKNEQSGIQTIRSKRNVSKNSSEQKSRRYDPYQERRHVEKYQKRHLQPSEERRNIEKYPEYLEKNQGQRSKDAFQTPEENDVLEQLTKERTKLPFDLNQKTHSQKSIEELISMEEKKFYLQHLGEPKTSVFNVAKPNSKEMENMSNVAEHITKTSQSEVSQINVDKRVHVPKTTDNGPKSNHRDIEEVDHNLNHLLVPTKDDSKIKNLELNKTNMEADNVDQFPTTTQKGSKSNQTHIERTDIEKLNHILSSSENGSQIVTSLMKEFEEKDLETGPELECVKYIHPDAVKEIETRAFNYPEFQTGNGSQF